MATCALTEATNYLMNEEGQTHMYQKSLQEVKKEYGLKDAKSYTECLDSMNYLIPYYPIVSWVNITSIPDGPVNFVIMVCKDEDNDYTAYIYKSVNGKLKLVKK